MECRSSELSGYVLYMCMMYVCMYVYIYIRIYVYIVQICVYTIIIYIMYKPCCIIYIYSRTIKRIFVDIDSRACVEVPTCGGELNVLNNHGSQGQLSPAPAAEILKLKTNWSHQRGFGVGPW
jgi:hypothetical protein